MSHGWAPKRVLQRGANPKLLSVSKRPPDPLPCAPLTWLMYTPWQCNQKGTGIVSTSQQRNTGLEGDTQPLRSSQQGTHEAGMTFQSKSVRLHQAGYLPQAPTGNIPEKEEQPGGASSQETPAEFKEQCAHSPGRPRWH